jgi:hypothetical protein
MHHTFICYLISFITGAVVFWVVSSRIDAAQRREADAKLSQELQDAHDHIRRRRMGE